ncbi:hypothetical protein MF4836_20410 [Pseudomonas sp. MF4836]|nr:hypothetical protein MF4836_20410 [Pseudomonas sp. MF4836]
MGESRLLYLSPHDAAAGTSRRLRLRGQRVIGAVQGLARRARGTAIRAWNLTHKHHLIREQVRVATCVVEHLTAERAELQQFPAIISRTGVNGIRQTAMLPALIGHRH